jgi:DNA-binding MarR family transcriptional regulator
MPISDQHHRTDGFRLEEFLPYRVAVVTDQIIRAFAENYESEFNLTVSEWRLLAVVAESGTLSPTAAGHRTSMDKVKVSRAAQSLVGKGLLRQNKDPNDGRGRLLRLTRRGTTAHAGMVPLAFRLEADVFGDLSRAERATLERVLTKITTRLETNSREADDS